MITTIIFDAFGTLFEVETGGSAKYIMEIISSYGHNIDEKAFLNEWKAFYTEHTNSGSDFLKEHDIFALRIKMLYERYHIEREADADRDYLIAGAYKRKIYAEVPDVITELQRKYKIFIGSNTDNEVLAENMKNNYLIVDKIYTSENLKCYKPAHKFFRQILLENNLDANEVLFVGDSLSDDVFAPQAVGMKAVWLNRNGQTVPDGVQAINNLNELLYFLDYKKGFK